MLHPLTRRLALGRSASAQEGKTALHMVDPGPYDTDAPEVVKLLLAEVQGLDVSEPQGGAWPFTPLHNAAMKRGQVAADVTKLLLEAGADANAALKARQRSGAASARARADAPRRAAHAR